MNEMSQNQLERLNFIDFRLFFAGRITRADLMARFGIARAAATRDIGLYKETVPENIAYDPVEKVYHATPNFSCHFIKEIEGKRLLLALVHGMGDDFGVPVSSLVPFELPSRLHAPFIKAFATISRAIYNGRAVRIDYISENGRSTREIVPFSFAGNGLRWHVRAFDRKRQIFGDFVINRITSAEVIYTAIAPSETKDHDHQWNRMVDLEIAPHPAIAAAGKSTEFIEHEHGMKGGYLKHKVRAAMAGYILRLWNVDCTRDATLPSNRQLWLKNPETLYGVDSAKLAPGYVPGNTAKAENTDDFDPISL